MIPIICKICTKPINDNNYCNFHYHCLAIKDKKKVKIIVKKDKKTKIEKDNQYILKVYHKPEDTTIFI